MAEIDQSLTMVQRGEGMEITNVDQFKAGGEWLKGAKALVKKIKAHHALIKDRINDAKQAVVDAEKSELTPLQTAIAIVEGKMIGWKTAFDKKAEAAALPAPGSTVPSYAEKVEVKGTTIATRWHAELVDKEVALRWILAELDAGNVDVLAGVEIHMPYFNEKARLMESKLNIPGISAHFEKGITSRNV